MREQKIITADCSLINGGKEMKNLMMVMSFMGIFFLSGMSEGAGCEAGKCKGTSTCKAKEAPASMTQSKEACGSSKVCGSSCPSCKAKEAPASTTPIEEISVSSVDAKLEYLIPIAVGITAGCENCTVTFVEKAIENGCPKEKVEEVIGIVESIQKMKCFREAVGEEIPKRMEKPIEAGRKTLEKW